MQTTKTGVTSRLAIFSKRRKLFLSSRRRRIWLPSYRRLQPKKGGCLMRRQTKKPQCKVASGATSTKIRHSSVTTARRSLAMIVAHNRRLKLFEREKSAQAENGGCASSRFCAPRAYKQQKKRGSSPFAMQILSPRPLMKLSED